MQTLEVPDKEVHLDEILESGRLVAITDYNSTNYFIYRGEPMGYQYELLQELANHLGIRLDVVVSNELDETFTCLLHGQCDLIALNLTVTKERRKKLNFTIPHSQTRQVLVQRKPEGWEKMTAGKIDSHLIRNQLDLAGKTVYVQQNSSYQQRLQNLSDEIGDTIHIVPRPEVAERLVMMVAGGEIDYTVCDENVALVNQTYYENLDVSTPVSFPQSLAWAVKPGADELRKTINEWLGDFRRTLKYHVIYNKYFKSRKSARIFASDYYTLGSGNISAYDEVIREQSRRLDWDWRLLASLIYQESRFDPVASSWAGAYGLMQLMPTTMRRFGVSRESSPEKQIEAGVSFLKWLDDRFRGMIRDPGERIRFILAAYNVGYGHIIDARNLAEKYGGNPDVWEDQVEEFLLKKSDPGYYQDPVVKYGYCRGTETVRYVEEIMERYNHYRNIIQPDIAEFGEESREIPARSLR